MQLSLKKIGENSKRYFLMSEMQMQKSQPAVPK